MFVIVLGQAWLGMSSTSGVQANWTWIAISLLLICLGEAMTGVGLARAISVLGQPTGIRAGIHVHFVTAPARVLPGFLGTTMGRVGVAARYGLGSKQVAAASLLEPSISALVAGFLGLAFIRAPIAAAGDLLQPAWRLAVIGLSVVIVALVIIATLRFLRRSTVRRPAKPHLWGLLFLVYLMVWLLFGAALMALIEALGGGGLSIGEASAVFAVSWLLGFVVIVVPGGLGVREGAMVFLLTPWISSELAATLAVVSRLLWLLATGVVFALSVLTQHSEVKGAQ